MRIDIHQHHWSGALLEALSRRNQFPFARIEGGDWVVYSAGEKPARISEHDRDIELRAAQLRMSGFDHAIVALSSPIGIEDLPVAEANRLIDAYLEGVRELPEGFRHWGAVSAWRPDPDVVETQIASGAVGLGVPAGALAAPEGWEKFAPALDRLEQRGVPLFVHPGPGPFSALAIGEPRDAWWPALTRYVADMSAAWHAFLAQGRSNHPQLKVVFAMLGGLAPLHNERLAARGGPAGRAADPLAFYDTSSYGRRAAAAVADVVGESQIVYGSDLPVIEHAEPPASIDEDLVTISNPARLLGSAVSSWRAVL